MSSSNEIICNYDYGEFASFNGRPYKRRGYIFNQPHNYNPKQSDEVDIKEVNFLYGDNYPEIPAEHKIWSGAEMAATYIYGHKSDDYEPKQTPKNYIFRQHKLLRIHGFSYTVETGGSLQYIFQYTRSATTISENHWTAPCSGVARIVVLGNNNSLLPADGEPLTSSWKPEIFLNSQSLRTINFIDGLESSIPVKMKAGDTFIIKVQDVTINGYFGPFSPGTEKGATTTLSSMRAANWNLIFLPDSY